MDPVSLKTVKIWYTSVSLKTSLVFHKTVSSSVILQPWNSYSFSSFISWNWQILVQKFTMKSIKSTKTSYLLKESGNFDSLKTWLVPYFIYFVWNWADLLKIITDILESLLIFCVNLPFYVKLTRFCETGLPIFRVSLKKFTYFLCKNTSFWPVFVKKWGFIILATLTQKPQPVSFWANETEQEP